VALVYLASVGQRHVVRIMLMYLLDPRKSEGVAGWTALMEAALWGHEEIIQDLLEAGKFCGGSTYYQLLRYKYGTKALDLAQETAKNRRERLVRSRSEVNVRRRGQNPRGRHKIHKILPHLQDSRQEAQTGTQPEAQPTTQAVAQSTTQPETQSGTRQETIARTKQKRPGIRPEQRRLRSFQKLNLLKHSSQEMANVQTQIQSQQHQDSCNPLRWDH
jgi:hypothetical protein